MLRLLRRNAVVLLGLVCTVQFPTARASTAEEPTNKPAYIVLGEFTVNMPGDGNPLSYVVVGITIEAMPMAAGELREITPRLKEAIMRRLMVLAERGALQPGRTDPMVLKTALLDSIAGLRPDSVRDVLITRLIYG
jgi:flagellar basal body-associated protein FliL